MMRKTMAILGDTGEFFPAPMEILMKQDLRLLYVSEDEAKKNIVKKELEHLQTSAEVEFISCEREGCWEADIITLFKPEKASPTLIEKIKEVATQKIVLIISEDTKQPERSAFRKLLPNSKVVEIFFEAWKKEFLVNGKDSEATAEVRRMFEF